MNVGLNSSLMGEVTMILFGDKNVVDNVRKRKRREEMFVNKMKIGSQRTVSTFAIHTYRSVSQNLQKSL